MKLDLLVHGRVACIDFRTWDLHGAALASFFRLRHKMFYPQYWEAVRRFQGMEYDQYDTPAATYLVWVDRDQNVWGGVRVAPMDRPYMLKDNWPDMCATRAPESPSIWEMTRLCIDGSLSKEVRRLIKHQLICALLEFGLLSDVDSMVGVMPPKLWKSVFIDPGCPSSQWGLKRSSAGKRPAPGLCRLQFHHFSGFGRQRESISRLCKNGVTQDLPGHKSPD